MTKRKRLLVAIEERELNDFNGLCVSDLSEIPEKYKGEVLHVNDHGNITLYDCFKNGNVREVYGLV